MSSRTGKRKPDDEVITTAVPAIIEPHVFEQVRRQLHARSPKVVAPRVTTGPILLTGLAVCATCEGAMTLRTGTSKTGRVHRYYSCSTCNRKGKTACKGRSVRMEKLDELVTTQLAERLFQPERLAAILSSLSARRAEKADAVNARIAALQRELSDADEKLGRLYKLIEEGVTEIDDVLKDRLNVLKADRDRSKAALERAKSHSLNVIQIDPALLEKFGRTMRENFTSGSIPFRKAYLQSLISVIEVDDTAIRIKGSRDVLEKAVLASRNGAIPGSQMSTGWRSLGESNPCFSLERVMSIRLMIIVRAFRDGDLRTWFRLPNFSALEQQLGYSSGRLDPPGDSGLMNLRVSLSGPLITSCFVAPIGIDALIRVAAPAIGKLRKLILQRMPARLDSGHVFDELPNLASQLAIYWRFRAL